MYNTHLVFKTGTLCPVAPHIIITLCPRIVLELLLQSLVASSAAEQRLLWFLIMCHSKKCWHQQILKQKTDLLKLYEFWAGAVEVDGSPPALRRRRQHSPAWTSGPSTHPLPETTGLSVNHTKNMTSGANLGIRGKEVQGSATKKSNLKDIRISVSLCISLQFEPPRSLHSSNCCSTSFLLHVISLCRQDLAGFPKKSLAVCTRMDG